jgi:hypothetical protein
VSVAVALFAAACGDDDGTRRVVVNQRVCGNIAFLKLELGRTNRLVLDNTDHSDDQSGMALVLDRFPVDVVGAIPEGSTIGSPYSTIRLNAAPGESMEVDLRPTFTGIYPGSCRINVRPGGGSVQIRDYKLDFQLTDS